MQSNSSWPAVSHSISLMSSPFKLTTIFQLSYCCWSLHSTDVCRSHYHLQQWNRQLQTPTLHSPYSLLQKVHPDGLLVFSSEDSFAIFLDHRGFAHRAIAHYDNLERVESVYWNKTLRINLYLREPWLWKVLNITTPHMNSFICLNMLNTSKALWTQPSLIMAYNLV